jgi:rubrerythrin
MKKYAIVLTLILLSLTMAGAAYAVQNPPVADRTLENFQTAFNGESNAHARYLAFATKADQEGYGEVASLFRATARAEEIHTRNHAEQIRKLGGNPQAKVETPVVKSTLENLEVAIRGEAYERDIMYPDFRKQAWGLGNKDAVRMFNYAREAEGEHAKLFMEAHNNLDNMQGKGRTYYVCEVCGYTTKDLDFLKCHTCFSPKERFQQVS